MRTHHCKLAGRGLFPLATAPYNKRPLVMKPRGTLRLIAATGELWRDGACGGPACIVQLRLVQATAAGKRSGSFPPSLAYAGGGGALAAQQRCHLVLCNIPCSHHGYHPAPCTAGLTAPAAQPAPGALTAPAASTGGHRNSQRTHRTRCSWSSWYMGSCTCATPSASGRSDRRWPVG